MTRRPVAALAALALGLLPAGAAAAPQRFPYALVASTQPVQAPPPLGLGRSAIQAQVEVRVPGRVDSDELVDVGIGPDGAPLRVAVTQRLDVRGTGDYSFVVPATATDVAPGPGTQSQPGLRDVGLIWQGFSSRRRVLSATATIEPRAAVRALPIAVQVRAGTGSSVVRLRSLALRDVAITTFDTTRAQLLGALARMRRGCEPNRLAGGPWYVYGSNGRGAKLSVFAPLHVTGTVGATRIDVVLGRGGRAERTLTVPGASAPAIRLRAEPLAPCAMLPSDAEVSAAADPLATVQTALAQVATAWAYRRFLDTPDPKGASAVAYVYRSVPRPPRAAAPKPGGGADDTLAVALGVLLAAALLAGLATLWARS